jgi:enoyl-CoA hydratase/carnithine racemase
MTVTLERSGPVAQLRLDRPEALNAFDASMVERMRERIAEVRADPDIRAVVLAGHGPSFCTGVDIKGLASGQIDLQWFRDWHDMTTELERLDVPLVVALHGHCLGGGLMLTLAADYRVAADDLHIGLGAVRHGILPGSAPHRLAAAVGAVAARRLCLFGEYIGADEALRIGLVDRLVPAGELDAAAEAVADRAASLSRGALRELKRLLRAAPYLDDDAYEIAYLAAQQRCLADRQGLSRRTGR